METLKQIFMTAGLALLLATTSAFGECIIVDAVAQEKENGFFWEDPVCEGFQFCILSEVTGEPAGDLWFYSTYYKNKGNKLDKAYQLVDPFDTELPFWFGNAVARIVTQDGEIYMSSNAIYDDDSTVFTEVTIVTGGTGMYEGATGNVVSYVDPRVDPPVPPDEGGYHVGPIYMIGRICTP